MRLLVVKTSSLGDVVHALAPVTDAAAAVPGLTCDWLVEEAYRDIPSWHPAVRRVIPCALRRWRRAPLRAVRSGEWTQFRAALRAESYDLVLDAQGLLKSAWLASRARGPVAGRGPGSVRETIATLFYGRRIAVDPTRSEVDQLRDLFAAALGYPAPGGPVDFGLERARVGLPARGAPYAVLCHGAAWPSKLWPVERWQALGRALRTRGLAIRLPWGDAAERTTAEAIAAACGGTVLPALGLAALARELAGARLVVGLDTGLTHLAVALGVPAVALYGPTVPVLERVVRGELVNLCSTGARVVDAARPTTVPLGEVEAAVARLLDATPS